jgi:polyhydroxyalkanoate synthesis regulator phasin
MNSNNVTQLIQQSFRVTLGATASLLEVLQDPQKRDENLSKLSQELEQLAQEWAARGEMTEQEARNFVDTLLSRQNQASSATSDPTNPASTTTASPEVQLELQELTAQLAAIRAELEKLRNQDSAT